MISASHRDMTQYIPVRRLPVINVSYRLCRSLQHLAMSQLVRGMPSCTQGMSMIFILTSSRPNLSNFSLHVIDLQQLRNHRNHYERSVAMHK